MALMRSYFVAIAMIGLIAVVRGTLLKWSAPPLGSLN
jgi:hypothetical protein